MEDRLPNIDKLDDSNWPVWKLQISTYLEARELWSLCSGNENAPDEPHMDNERAVAAYAQRLNQYQVHCARVKSILLQTISTAQLHVVAHRVYRAHMQCGRN